MSGNKGPSEFDRKQKQMKQALIQQLEASKKKWEASTEEDREFWENEEKKAERDFEELTEELEEMDITA